ncbi:endonuclease-reverse transcriptase [Trichonephila clavipes]|nr:endonuclease-reverse transcriptase [Trichonephila clavipes]
MPRTVVRYPVGIWLMASAECMEGPRAPTPHRCRAGCSKYRTSVTMHNATVQQPLTTMSPSSNLTAVMLEAETGFVSKHVIPSRCPCPPFIAPLAAQNSCSFQSRINEAMDTLRTFHSTANGFECQGHQCRRLDSWIPMDSLYKEPQVTQVIRSNRLRWLGHIWRSPKNNQTRAYTFKNPMGSQTRGRPPTRWIDDVENDLKTKY